MTQQQIAYQNMLVNQKQAEASMLQAEVAKRAQKHKETVQFPTEVGTGLVSTAGGILALALL